MASLLNHIPGMNAVAATTSHVTKVQVGGFKNMLVYLLLAIILVLVYMLLKGYKLSFKMFDFVSDRYKTWKNTHRFWDKGMSGVNNLMISEDELPDNMNNKYTYHFDLLLANTRNLTNVEGPYRHIFHRGSDELYSGTDMTDGSSSSKPLPPYGLPKRLNPGLFLDPNTNDIIVFVDTKGKSGDVYRESGRIVDVPVDKPLRITVSVHNQVLEVNMNCKLELTKVLAGEPKPVENVIYGLCGTSAAEASIQNLFVWSYAVANENLKYFCPMPFPAFQPPPTKSCGASTDTSLLSNPATVVGSALSGESSLDVAGSLNKWLHDSTGRN